MKKLITFLTLLTLFFTTSWAETATLTQAKLGITNETDFTSGEKTVDDITYAYIDLKKMKGSAILQAKASTGTIYNTTAFPGTITTVALTYSGTWYETKILGSPDGVQWAEVSATTNNTNSKIFTGDFEGNGYKYFKITRAGTTATAKASWTKIVITYTVGGDDGGDIEEYVDFGLPSGTLWATKNIGASRPEEYGRYFAWGETAPKADYGWETYQWSGDRWNTMTKYCTDSKYGLDDFVDGKTELDLEDDAAKANLGPNWRMPTKEQLNELLSRCTWTWTTKNGIKGYQVSKNGKSIFLPAAGYHFGAEFYSADKYCYYWSSSLDTETPNQAHDLWGYDTSNGMTLGSATRSSGYTVRAVRAPIPEVSTVKEILALEDGTEFKFTGNLVVSGKSNDGIDLYAQDGTGGVHFWDPTTNTIPNYTFGQIIPPGFLATKTIHNGAVELIDMQDMSPATTTGELNAEVLTPSQVTQNNPFIYALINNALIEKQGTYPRINVNGEIVSLQEGTFPNVDALIVGGIYNIYGVTNWNNNARFMPLSFELLDNVHTITCQATSNMPLNHDQQTFKPGGEVEAKVNGNKVTLAATGDEVTLDITPWNGYTLSSVTVNGVEITPVDGVYSFIMPNEDVEVIANFIAGGYNITVVSSDGEHHGTYNGPYLASVGETVEFTITDLEPLYSVMGVSATFTNKNGGTTSVAVTKENGVYSFGMPPFDVTIKVHYSHHLEVSGDWTLVTDASQLQAGQKYIIVRQDSESPCAMSTTQNRNNRGTTGIELNEDFSKATITDEDTQVFTLEGDNNGWYFNAGSGYLYAASSANNWLRTGHHKNDDAKAAISISGGIASIVFQGSNTHNDLRYNPNGNDEPLFSCYLETSGLQKASLYTREFNPGAIQTLEPPEFWPDPSEQQPEGFYVELWTEYEEMGAIYYMLDHEPTNWTDLTNNGNRCDYGYGWGDFYVPGPGPHKIYAGVVVEYEGNKYYSEIVCKTYETYTLGDWKLLTNTRDLFVGQYEYIIVNEDCDKAVGDYDDTKKCFNPVPCNEKNNNDKNNVVFDPSFETATVNSEDVKIFSLEFVQGNGTWREGYLYDADGYYYHGTGPMTYYEEQYQPTIVRTQVPKNPEDLVWAYNGGYSGYVYLEHDNSNIVYNIDKDYFDCYNWNYPLKTDNDQRTKIRMYYRAKPITLADLCRSGNVRGEYTISDELIAVACAKDDWGNVYLWCKDQAESINPSVINPEEQLPEGMEDYMTVNAGFNGDWDQSNWIALRFTTGGNFRGESSDLYYAISDYVGWKIKPETVKGVYVDRSNYQLDITSTSLEKTEPFEYPLNLYCPANFLHDNIDADGAVGITPNTQQERHYFFMNPKIQEVCEITYAVWRVVKDENENIIDRYFVLPAPQGTMNATNIPGAFYVDWIYNNIYVVDPQTGEEHDLRDDLVPDAAYKFKAIVQKPAIIKKAGAPSLRDGDEPATVTPGNYIPDWSDYIVYPFDFDPKKPENIVTAIETVNVVAGNGKVVSVKYVNIAGMVSDRPFQGVNIVVTRYSDGSTTTTKIIK